MSAGVAEGADDVEVAAEEGVDRADDRADDPQAESSTTTPIVEITEATNGALLFVGEIAGLAIGKASGASDVADERSELLCGADAYEDVARTDHILGRRVGDEHTVGPADRQD